MIAVMAERHQAPDGCRPKALAAEQEKPLGGKVYKDG